MERGKTSKVITLQSNDGKEFVVPESVALFIPIIRHVIEDGCSTQEPIPLSEVTAQTLAMVIDYCQQQFEAADDESDTDTAGQRSSITPVSSRMPEEELTNWDKKFRDVDMDTLYDLLNAANYLAIEGLLQLTTQKVVDIIKGKTLEEMRQIFKIKSDFTAEEQEKMHREFPWAFK